MLQRAIDRQKFHATLERKLDNAIEDWKTTQPDDTPKPTYKEDGWTMSIHSPWSDDND